MRLCVGLLVFIAWTIVVRSGISHGSRHTIWTSRTFGSWPEAVGLLDGSNNMELSIRATYVSGESLGATSAGARIDYGDPGDINGSRFVTGSDASRVTSMSAFVAAPVDAAPFNHFELAIYADDAGAPGRLIARSTRGTLVPDAWNSVPLDVVLSPGTAYWLCYNTDGRTDAVNNLRFSPVVAEPLDSVIRSPRSEAVRRVALGLSLLGSPPVATTFMLALALWVCRERRGLALWLCVGFALGIALEYGLKHTVFFPYSTYPSGHALRITFIATTLVALIPRRDVRGAVTLLTVLVCLGAVHPDRHYSEEVIGGALAGWMLASGALGLAGARPGDSASPDVSAPSLRPSGRGRHRPSAPALRAT